MMDKIMKVKKESKAAREKRMDDDHEIIARASKAAGEESVERMKTRLFKAPPTPKTTFTRDELKNFLKENLKLSVGQTAGGFTDPNARRIELKLDDEVISYIEFDVRQKREYEG